MALRSIDQRYWTDPYVESLSATEKLASTSTCFLAPTPTSWACFRRPGA